MSRTYIYVDGFNLYYGAVKDTPYKWLNLMAMCRGLLKPHHDILVIKYFTAHVHSTQYDPQKQNRQEVYLKALEAYIPEIEIRYGHFLSNPKKRKTVRNSQNTLTSLEGSENLYWRLLNSQTQFPERQSLNPRCGRSYSRQSPPHIHRNMGIMTNASQAL